MRGTIQLTAALLVTFACPASLHAREAAPSQDRTGEVLAVTKLLWDLQNNKILDNSRSKLRIYEHSSQRSLSFMELRNYIRQCPLKGIDLPYPIPRVGPVLVRWKCETEDDVKSVGFYFENGRLAAAAVGLPDVPLKVQIKVQPRK